MRSVLLGVLLAMALASPAGAFMKCKTWEGLDGAQRSNALRAEINRIVSSNESKKYGSINKVAVRKCLEQRIPQIEDDFDSVCMDAHSASMNALNREFERFIWDCVGGRGR